MLLRLSIQKKPQSQPDKSQRAGNHEGPTPSHVHGDPRNYERCDDGAEVCTGIEYSGGECSLLPGEPFGYRLDAGWENTCLPKSQSGARDNKAGKGASDCV